MAACMMAAVTDFEDVVQAVYEASLRSGDVAIDVGAHVGRHTIPMARAVAPTGKTHACEPLAQCQAALAERLVHEHPELEPVVTIYPYALSDHQGVAEFVVATAAPAYSGLRERVYDIPTALERIEVPLRTIDALFLDLPSLRYVKMDVEGGELDVCRGAAAVIEKFRPLVTFEFGINSAAGYRATPADMARFWLDRGYTLYDVEGRDLDLDAFIESATVQRVWDYVAVPTENCELAASVRRALGAPDTTSAPARRRLTVAVSFTPRGERERLKREVGVGERPIALLVNGGHPSNRETAGALFEIAATTPDITFLLAGGRSLAPLDRPRPANLGLMGVVDDDTLGLLLALADIAVHPLSSGSGSSPEIAAYLAAGLPVITTPLGARGYDFVDGENVLIRPVEAFSETIARLLGDPRLADELARRGRCLVEARHDWTVLASGLLRTFEALAGGPDARDRSTGVDS